MADNPVVSMSGITGNAGELENTGNPGSPMARDQMELLTFLNSWQGNAADWRAGSWETKWNEYRRDSEAIYDPVLKAKKKAWQSVDFIPITPSHRENIQAHLVSAIAGARPLLEMEPRAEYQDDQSANIKDLILREAEKSRFQVGWNAVEDDATTYGSGFVRVRFEVVVDKRMARIPKYEEVSILNPASVARALAGQQQLVGYDSVEEDVETYRGIRFEPISIWDLFIDPLSTIDPRRYPMSYRYKASYNDIVRGAETGYYFADAPELVKGADDGDSVPSDKAETFTDREILMTRSERTEYGKELECFEWWGKLPKKWAYINGEEIDDPEKLVSCRVLFHKNAVFAIETNENYDGLPPIFKIDYFPVMGQPYGRGIPEMLKDIQSSMNETVNARRDCLNLSLNQKIAVIERAVLYPKEDFNTDLGGCIRFNLQAMQAAGISDVRQAIMPIPMPPIDRAAFIDPQELERYAQERTSNNRVTMGTAGQVKDANDTLGGMQLLKQSAGEKFAYIGMMQEFTALHDIFRMYWQLIYQNIRPEDVQKILGPERAQTFQLLSPESVESDYIYQPLGVYTQDSKGAMQARIQSISQQFMGKPWFDEIKAFDKIVQTAGIDPNALKLSPDEMQQKLIADGMMKMPMPVPGSNKVVPTNEDGVNAQA